MKPPGTHSASTALLLSLLCCAFAGQIYNRQYLKALVIALVMIGSGVVTYGVSSLVLYVAVAVDAYLIGQRINRGEPVGQWQFF